MTEILKQVAFEALREQAEAFSGSDGGDGTVFVPPVGALLWISSVNTTDTGILTAEIFADHEDLPEPIVFMAVGNADDYREAATRACEQWFQVVFPVLHSAFADHETLNVKAGDMQVVDGKGRRYAWKVHSGPIRVLAAGQGPPPAEPEQTAMIQVLMNDITGVSTTTIPFWIDAYAASRSDKEVLADCRMTNVLWDAGTASLRTYAAQLRLDTFVFVSHRQFILLMPANAARLNLRPAPAPAPVRRVPWWKRIFRKA